MKGSRRPGAGFTCCCCCLQWHEELAQPLSVFPRSLPRLPSPPSFPPSLRGSQPPSAGPAPCEGRGAGGGGGGRPGEGKGKGRKGRGRAGARCPPAGTRDGAAFPSSTTSPRRLHERRRPLRREAAAAHSPQRLLHVHGRELGWARGLRGAPGGYGCSGDRGELQMEEEGGKGRVWPRPGLPRSSVTARS